jgi:threonine dehydrogenase-like Zn-dependent dehydrogenase
VSGQIPPGIPRFATDLFVPHYRPARSGDWELRVAEMAISPGYWSDPVLVEQMAVLIRDGRSWMSLTPFELESQGLGVRAAEGHVLIFGLGLGWAACACAALPAVARVTVVERDPDVIALHRELDVFAQLPAEAQAKLRIVEDDAYSYRPDQAVHVLLPDIWLPLVNDGRFDEVRAMQANVGALAVHFWGQEMELVRHAVAAGRALDTAGIDATIAATGLPLIGAGNPDYAAKAEAAARRWLRGRWLPGSAPRW